MLFSDDSFKLSGKSVTAVVTGNCESTVSTRYLVSRRLTLRVRNGVFTETVSVQTLGGYFTCLVRFKISELAADVDISLGLDWLAYLREHLAELGALGSPSPSVRYSV